MATAPKPPPSRDQVVEAVETMGRHLDAKIDHLDAKIDGVKAELLAKIDGVDAKIDGVKTEMSAKFDGVDAKIDGVKTEMSKLAQISQANDLELNRKLDRLLAKLG